MTETSAPAPVEVPAGPAERTSVHRDFFEKVAGTLPYADDWRFPGMLHGVVVRATVPCARILAIDTAAARAVPGVHAVLTAVDIPHNGVAEEASGVGLDQIVQPVLAEDRVRYVGEPVALVAAESQAVAEEAAALVEVECAEERGVFDAEEALRDGATLVHRQGNECVRWRIERGDPEGAMEQADVVVEETYRTQRVDHAYLEPEAGIGWFDGDGVLTLRVSTQVLEHARELADMLELPHSRVRVIAAYMGGGFGGKEDMTVEPHLAALVWVTRRPVRMVWSRQESLLARQKRHPLTMRYRTGATRDGRIVAQHIRVLGDAGAYPLLSSRVLFAAAVDSTGPYRVEHVSIEAVAAYTHTVPNSAFRGFGGMQVHFGYESQMDRLAQEVGLDPVEVRERNFVSRGDRRGTGEPLETDVGVRECLATALGAMGQRPEPRAGERIGRGFACGMQHYGRALFFADRASAWIGLEQDGTMVIRAGVTDLGAGQAASLADVAGDVLGVTVDRTSVHIGDSALTPLCGGTYATRQLYMSGNAVLKVARGLRSKLEPVAAALLECPQEQLEFAANRVGVREDSERAITMRELSRAAEARGVMPYCHDTFEAGAGRFDHSTGQGQTFPDYTYGAHAVDVAVDEETGKVRVLRYVACHDLGHVIDRQRAEGQIQGAVAQGAGYALSEEMTVEGGVCGPGLFADYLVPTACDLPDIEAIVLELHPGKGPFGARGVGEPPIGPPAPAIASAVEDATGVRFRTLPITPQRIRVAARERSAADA